MLSQQQQVEKKVENFDDARVKLTAGKIKVENEVSSMGIFIFCNHRKQDTGITSTQFLSQHSINSKYPVHNIIAKIIQCYPNGIAG